MRFLFAHFLSFSEFARNSRGQHRTGDCGPLVVLLILHSLWPDRYPLTGDALDALVKDMAAHGCTMNANGMTNIPDLDRYLTYLGVRHVTVGYDDFAQKNKTLAAVGGDYDLAYAGLHADAKALAGPSPRYLLIEWQAAGAGLHDDERPVRLHYSGLGGIDTGKKGDGVGGGYLRGDGDSDADSKTQGTAPILTPWHPIVDAEPIAYIAIWPLAVSKPKPPVPPKPPAAPPPPPPTPDHEAAQDQRIAALEQQFHDASAKLLAVEAVAQHTADAASAAAKAAEDAAALSPRVAALERKIAAEAKALEP